VAFQRCISPACGATYGVEEVRVACDVCGSLLDVIYDWNRLEPPTSFDFFERKWQRRYDPHDFSGVWRFYELLPFTPKAQIVTIDRDESHGLVRREHRRKPLRGFRRLQSGAWVFCERAVLFLQEAIERPPCGEHPGKTTSGQPACVEGGEHSRELRAGKRGERRITGAVGQLTNVAQVGVARVARARGQMHAERIEQCGIRRRRFRRVGNFRRPFGHAALRSQDGGRNRAVATLASSASRVW